MEDQLHKPIACGAVLGAVFGVVMWILVFNSGSLLFAMPGSPDGTGLRRAVQADGPGPAPVVRDASNSG